MDKYYLKDGKQVFIGDWVIADQTGNDDTQYIKKVKLSKRNAEELAENGVIRIDKDITIQDVMASLIEKSSSTSEEIVALYEHPEALLYPYVVFELFLKETAILLDERYDGHIKDCPYIYTISKNNGLIYKFATNEVNLKNLAAFRSADDAQKAISILKPIYKEVFNDK